MNDDREPAPFDLSDFKRMQMNNLKALLRLGEISSADYENVVGLLQNMDWKEEKESGGHA